MRELDLGSESVGSLVKKFSVPCVISMVVAALYNIVDQIFIGWSEAAAYGNAASNIVYPFTVSVLGLALLVGDGTAAEFSIALGRGDKMAANRIIGNGSVMLAVLAVVMCALGIVCREQILRLFGGDPNEVKCYSYATDYLAVICLGIPFYMIGQGLNGAIRADGSPKFAMSCTIVGAITNLILDPIFIFWLGMGVKGAAIATVIGQALTFVMSVVYLARAKNFKLDRRAAMFDLKTARRITSVGMASLIVQLSIVVIIAVNNNLLARYAYKTVASTGIPFGAVISLAVVGIVMKVFGIVVSIVIGISLGGQPIIGFNIGAGHPERVRETVRLITRVVIAVGTTAFLIFELVPSAIIFLFGSQNPPEYMEYARLCIRIFLAGIILTCYVKSTAVILQSMGSSTKSTFLALLRDVIVFVPISIALATCSESVVIMLWAAAASDVIAAVFGVLFMRDEMKRFDALKMGRHNI